ncbi:MAG: uracil-DNA glycosylase [Sphingomonadales bacterium]|nr:uracil-DNA glycosylase [Sphingomonadales bacterium]
MVRIVRLAGEDDFDGWREAARALAGAGVPPEDVAWQVGLAGGETAPLPAPGTPFSVPRAFLTLAETVVRHSDPERFALLYTLLLRLRERPGLLAEGSDPLVRRLERMAKEGRQKAWRNEPARALTGTMAETSREAVGGNARAAWEAVREEARGCTRCHLYKHATQTVFGEGPVTAPLMFVGEQPGDQEDLAGRPFVGPAGQLFDRALGDAGIDRGQAYVTNAVKHFKFERRGKRRIHSKPDAGEIEACRWWIEQERTILRPTLTVALGATAARSLFGKAVTITATRGRAHALPDGGGEAWVTVHPSFLLRVQDDKEAEYAKFVADLVRVRQRLEAIA